MAEISEICEFEVPVSALYFATQCDGDKLVLSKLELTQEQAVALTWLINLSPETELRIKIEQNI